MSSDASSTQTPPALVTDPRPDVAHAADSGESTHATSPPPTPGLGSRFWLIFVGLWVVGFQVALESTIVTTAMPSIVRALHVGDNYVWVINAGFLATTATIPLYGQLADLFGRRHVMLAAAALFLLGAGLCGGARSPAMLIAGRAVMGAGGGGMTMLIDVIVSDLVPLRQRGQFMGLTFVGVNLGTALGPFLGGQIAGAPTTTTTTTTTTWRWVFWLCLPITGVALVVLAVGLRVPWQRRATTVRAALARVDVVGHAVLLAATVAVLWGLTYADTRYAWGDARILVPLVLGLAGLALYLAAQGTPRVCPHPAMPLRLFRRRTAAAAYVLSFVYMMLSLWRLYFLPVYFQAVLQSSSARAGVQLLPSVLMLLPSVAVSGAVVQRTGRFWPVHLVGFGLMVVGHGLLTLLGPHSATAAWVVVQIVVAFGSGLVITALLPAIQACLDDADTAAGVAAWGFVRALGVIWGTAIPSAVFNARFDQLAGHIADPAARAAFLDGHAYERASAAVIGAYENDTKAQIIEVYAGALRRMWQIGVVFAGLAFLLVFLERNLVLRNERATEYGLPQAENKSGHELEACPQSHA